MEESPASLQIIREATEKPIIGYAENIRDASTTLLSLVNDLLDFSKIECGKMEILPVEYEIANVLSEIMNMIEIKVANKGLDFTAHKVKKLLGNA